VGPEVAKTKLDERIRLGQELQESVSRVAFMRGTAQRMEADVDKWHGVNRELLRSLFDNDEVAETYGFARHIYMVSSYDTEGVRLVRVNKNLSSCSSALETVIETLPTYDRASEEATDIDARPVRPAPVNITIRGGTVGQVNLGQVQGNIETHVSAVTGPSAAEFKAAVKAFAEAVAKDRKLGERERGEVLEGLDYIAEEASKPPSQRRMTVLQRTIQQLPTLLSLAEQGKTAWDTFGPIITGFLSR
jgi:hypothetical protein